MENYTKIGADSSAENTPLPHNLSVKFVCPSPKVLDFNEKRLHWASVVRGALYAAVLTPTAISSFCIVVHTTYIICTQ